MGGSVVARASGALIGASVGLVLAAPVAIMAADVLWDGRWILYGGLALGALAGGVVADLSPRTGNTRSWGALDRAALIGSVARREAEGMSMLRRAFGGPPKSERAEPEQPRAWSATADAVEAPKGEQMDRQRERERDWNPAAPGMATGELNALLGRGSEFDGKLAFEGTVRIDGNFTGEITTSDTLIVGDGARVQAEITCGSVVVHGEVIGNIRATQSIELHKPARLKGDVTTPSLMVEKGVVFEGRSEMESAASSKIVPITASQGAD